MDVFDELLRGVRGQGAVFGRSALRPPWSLHFTDEAYLTLVIPMRGSVWILTEDGARRRVVEAEAAIVRGPAPFTLTDDPDADRSAVRREVRCLSDEGTAPGGEEGPDDLQAETVVLAAAYDVRAQVPQRLLQVLPSVLVVPDENEECKTMRAYLEMQLVCGRPGRQIVLDRLLDWLLVCTLRGWFELSEAESPNYYRALSDDVAGPALQAMHEDPAHAWTTASLAARAGVSRSTFAKRFAEQVGEGPMAYLTGWRMTLAADLLHRPDMTVAAVARRVGYADAFGFSAAFKRVQGVSPTAYRQAAEASPEEAVIPVG
ncbi:AraC family transcriptional regulator [Nocardiopsis sp. RSe5-2]|uniref:AraC family transcriptional regulator n=1 Tax=Nocardiopsis endophytica TaxID=3018445 RepID=A0ABT4TYF0_9ACTN|nr:AraC family transcriptional regulator [Nocardiopsis endophytica]MDA2809726.1 AraC family transcriptional regulator [Nocardiopsis endophytica]